MRSDGSGQRLLLANASTAFTCPVWSPDGSYIAATDGKVIHIVPWDGHPAATIPPTTAGSYIGSFAYSPDGNRLVVSEGVPVSSNSFDSRVWTVKTNNTERSASVRGLGASWTPRGDSILFVCFNDQFASQIDYRLCMMSPDGSGLRVLTTERSSSPFFTPDGARIAFSCDGGLCLMNRDGSNLARWPIVSLQFAWAPNGKMLAYRCGMSEPGRFNDDICAVSGDGTNFRNLTKNPGDDWYPSFAPLSSQ